MKTAAVIVAAGRGMRAGGGLPKQWRLLKGRAVADWTLDAFRENPSIKHIVLVVHPDDMERVAAYNGHPDTTVTSGGETRSESVRAGLRAIAEHGVSHVLIHDVARPLVSQDTINTVVEALTESDAAAPALAVTDALWQGKDGRVRGVQDRAGLFRAQTPQGFRFDAILAAHETVDGGAADDVEVARTAGIEVAIVPGDDRNMKLTTADDFKRAAMLMGETMDIRLGNGFDVHKFGPGSYVTLCGIEVPFDQGLVGHSDADVGMHAVTDAIYGALAEGDIGRHFPPSDAQWKGAPSHVFLEHAMSMSRDAGYVVQNVDCTLICEQPKIGPHAAEMQGRMADIMGIEINRVSVKATTSEQLGFTGRGEGIAAIATATLVRS